MSILTSAGRLDKLPIEDGLSMLYLDCQVLPVENCQSE